MIPRTRPVPVESSGDNLVSFANRFFLAGRFLVKLCPRFWRRRITFPLPVTLNLSLAPLCVFIFGIFYQSFYKSTRARGPRNEQIHDFRTLSGGNLFGSCNILCLNFICPRRLLLNDTLYNNLRLLLTLLRVFLLSLAFSLGSLFQGFSP